MMNLLQKGLGYSLVGFGSLFLLVALTIPFSEEPEREALLGCLILGGVTVVPGGVLLLSANNRKSSQLSQVSQAREHRLQAQLYELIEAKNGEFTLVEFAIAADIPAAEAKAFLNAQAKAFTANFDVSEQGAVIYQFPIS